MPNIIMSILSRINDGKNFIFDKIKTHVKEQKNLREALRIRRKKLRINNEII